MLLKCLLNFLLTYFPEVRVGPNTHFKVGPNYRVTLIFFYFVTNLFVSFLDCRLISVGFH